MIASVRTSMATGSVGCYCSCNRSNKQPYRLHSRSSNAPVKPTCHENLQTSAQGTNFLASWRMGTVFFTRATVIWSASTTGLPKHWRRRPGRPRQTWLRTIENDLRSLNLGLATAQRRAQNRTAWQTLVETATSLTSSG